MKNATSKSARFFSLLLLLTLLTACALPQQAGFAPDSVSAQAQPSATATPTLAPSATPRIAPSATPAPVSDVEQARAVAQQYLDALDSADYEQAAGLLSTFGLVSAGLTRGDAALALSQQRSAATAWPAAAVVEARRFDEQTALVRVAYTYPAASGSAEGGAAPDEEWLALRLENDQWRVNWGRLIDYRSLQTAAQATNGLTLKPVRLERYTDRLALVLLAQNSTNELLVLGQKNETLATFLIDDQPLVADEAQHLLQPLRSVPDLTITAAGLFERYPESVEIRRWKDYAVDPWFVFALE